MSVEEVMKAYEAKFGGLPLFLLRGMDDDEIVRVLSKCLETGEELEPEDPDADY